MIIDTKDTAEIEKFERMAEEWWDETGKFRPLHQMNPIRLKYITDHIAWRFDRDLDSDQPFKGLTILDIGCGGGLLCEPLTRLGAEVTGIDAAPTNIKVAKLHAEKEGLAIKYQNCLAEELAENGECFDVVLAMEVIEHVANPKGFVELIAKLTQKKGHCHISTLNRNPKSYLAAIIGAEYIMQWLPKGTHDWTKFVRPNELEDWLEAAQLQMADKQGMVYNPILRKWKLSFQDLTINYVITAHH